jgi:hypothetical protein
MRKLILTLAVITTLIGNVFSQKNTLSDALEVKSKNFAPIISDNEVMGYSVIYELDKLNENENSYRLSFLDNTLKVVSSTDFVESNNLFYCFTRFNRKTILVFFFDKEKEKIILKRFSVKGEVLSRVVMDIDSQMELLILRGWSTSTNNYQGVSPLRSINNNGYVYYTYEKSDATGLKMMKSKYAIKYFPDNESQKAWTFSSTSKYKGYESLGFLYEGNGMLVNTLIRKKKLLSNKGVENFLQVIDVKTGKQVFETKIETQKYKALISKGHINPSNGNIELYGTYSNLNDEMMKTNSLGFAHLVYNQKGELVSEKYNSWKDDIGKYLEIGKKDKVANGFYMFIHDIIKDEEGNSFVIGEQYKTAFSGVGVKVVIQDMMILKLNKNFDLVDVQVFEKEKSNLNVPNSLGLSSPATLGAYLYAMHEFDYCFSQTNKKTGGIYAVYKEFNKKDKQVIGVITHENGKFSSTKNEIDLKSKQVFIYKASPGNALIFEVKEKKADLRIEKLN